MSKLATRLLGYRCTQIPMPLSGLPVNALYFYHSLYLPHLSEVVGLCVVSSMHDQHLRSPGVSREPVSGGKMKSVLNKQHIIALISQRRNNTPLIPCDTSMIGKVKVFPKVRGVEEGLTCLVHL